MANKIIIAIGGSGARCAEALLYLCASGLGPRDRTYLLLVDADQTNGNVARAKEVADLYVGASQEGSEQFLATPLLKFPTLFDWDWGPLPKGKEDYSLRRLLAYNTLRDSLVSLCDALYARSYLDQSLEEGFRGRPAIGAAAFAGSDPAFWTSVRGLTGGGQEVRVFLFGSVFGGTGAAAMPVIPKLIRQSTATGATISIGGALLAPYFSYNMPPKEDNASEAVDVTGSTDLEADPANFVRNTRAALRYYLDQTEYNRLYVVGSRYAQTHEEYAKGGAKQKNRANIVELLAALAARHFLSAPENLSGDRNFYLIARGTDNDTAEGTKSFGWSDIPEKDVIKQRLGALLRMAVSYIVDFHPTLDAQLKKKRSRVPWFYDFIRLRKNIYGDRDKSFNVFGERYIEWVRDLHENPSLRLNLFKTHELANLDSFDRDQFPELVIGDPYDMSMTDIWRRMCSVPQSAGGKGDFLAALYKACTGDLY